MCNGEHEFVQRPNAKNGECHTCYKVRQRQTAKLRYQEARRFLLAEKVKRGCARCGYNENAHALQLDHIIPVRRKERGADNWNGIKAVQAVLADPNVQVLCANCHSIKTAEDMNTIRKENS